MHILVKQFLYNSPVKSSRMLNYRKHQKDYKKLDKDNEHKQLSSMYDVKTLEVVMLHVHTYIGQSNQNNQVRKENQLFKLHTKESEAGALS